MFLNDRMSAGTSKKVNFLVSSVSGYRCMRLVGAPMGVAVVEFSRKIGYTIDHG